MSRNLWQIIITTLFILGTNWKKRKKDWWNVGPNACPNLKATSLTLCIACILFLVLHDSFSTWLFFCYHLASLLWLTEAVTILYASLFKICLAAATFCATVSYYLNMGHASNFASSLYDILNIVMHSCWCNQG